MDAHPARPQPTFSPQIPPGSRRSVHASICKRLDLHPSGLQIWHSCSAAAPAPFADLKWQEHQRIESPLEPALRASFWPVSGLWLALYKVMIYSCSLYTLFLWALRRCRSLIPDLHSTQMTHGNTCLVGILQPSSSCSCQPHVTLLVVERPGNPQDIHQPHADLGFIWQYDA